MTDRRIVTCRYRSTPHVADAECVNAADVDEQVIADLRRLFAADQPPAVVAQMAEAVVAVVELHAPVDCRTLFPCSLRHEHVVCRRCKSPGRIDLQHWPCSTIRAIAKQLGVAVDEQERIEEEEQTHG